MCLLVLLSFRRKALRWRKIEEAGGLDFWLIGGIILVREEGAPAGM